MKKAFRTITMDRAFYALSLSIAIIFTLVIKLNNLNYNSPFADEAVYILVGKLGLFENDWWSLNPSSWMPGLPYIYTSIAALSYESAGIVGSRAVNVFLSILLAINIYKITQILSPKKNDILAGLTSFIVISTAAISIYISRLATYDIPSYYFLSLSGLYLISALKDKGQRASKSYFLASVFLSLSVLTKIITIIFAPLLVIVSAYYVHTNNKDNLKKYAVYFFIPSFVVLSLFFILNLGNLFSYASAQDVRESATLFEILTAYVDYISLPLFLLALSLPIMLYKRTKLTLILVTLAVIPLLFHLINLRIHTLDKHSFLSMMFFSPIIGLAVSEFVNISGNKITRSAAISIVCAVMLNFSLQSLEKASRYNRLWLDATRLEKIVPLYVDPGQKILTESGPTFMLYAYRYTHPTNITTFDWFEYKQHIGKEAYELALQEGYFDLIEIQDPELSKDIVHRRINDVVVDNLENNYELVHYIDNFYIYQKRT